MVGFSIFTYREKYSDIAAVSVSLQEKETAHKKDRENLENEVFLLEKRLQEDSKNMIDDLKAVSEKTRNEKVFLIFSLPQFYFIIFSRHPLKNLLNSVVLLRFHTRFVLFVCLVFV